MARKSTHTDKKLLAEGRKLLIKSGASKLSIRAIADAAQVNLGMFNYHFGSKENFIQTILGEIYEDFLLGFELGESKNDNELDTLRLQLLLITKFTRDNRHLILVLLNDVLSGEKTVQKFARVNMKKHFSLLATTLTACQKKGLIMKAPLPLLLTQIAASIGIVNLIPEVIKCLGISKVFGLGVSTVGKQLMTDAALEKRVEITLKGLSP